MASPFTPPPLNGLTMEALRKERLACHYLYLETLNCVIKSSCVPCLYKLFPDGGKDAVLAQVGATALSKETEQADEFLKKLCLPSNQRPELCPRAKADRESKPFTIYCSSVGAADVAAAPKSFLTVGDGDFTYSLSLANLLCDGSASEVPLTATSHESLQSVLTTYKPHAQETLAALRALGVTVLHGVDATALADTPELLRESKNKKRKLDEPGEEEKRKMKRYDVVIWNFPCISLPAGADGQARELQANKELLAKFFLNVRRCLTKGTGEVHISHKTIEPFSWWGIRQIASENGFDFAYAVVFDR
jgi:25S rRNA (uracil2634-N3)-methyltransferase